jgi:SAM-dependent methyltransferase
MAAPPGNLAMSALEFTGERFIPGTQGEIWIEHWHRYHFASRWAAGKRVLDVACGAGYGTALLARTAASAAGADISAEAVDYAKSAYPGQANLEFACAPCTQLPFADASFDVAISFETVEHITEQEAFLAELARVVKPGGLLLLSCPNKREYSDKRSFKNAFHVKELYRDELAKLVGAHFPEMAWYGQRPSFFSLIAPEGEGPSRGEVFEVEEAHPAEAARKLAEPLYFLVVASRDRAALVALEPAVSVFSDRDEWVHRDYEKVMKNLEITVARGEALEDQVRSREVSIAELQRDVRALREAMHEREAREASIAATREAELAAKERALAVKDAELAKRRGVAGWLRQPLAWLRDRLLGPPRG